MPYDFIPRAPIWTVEQARRETLNAQSTTADTQLTVCALDTPLRFGYGRCRVGGLLLRPIVHGSNLLLPFIVGRGPIHAIDSLELGNEALAAGISSTTYLGTTGQSINSWLQSAWALKGKTYADTLDGIAWGVLRIPSSVTGSINDLAITARMLKVYDPREETGSQTLGDPSTYEYSTNPALALADFISNTAYGRGETMDWASVADAADVCDQMVGSLPRASFGLMIDSVRSVDAIEETLRAYAKCFIVREGGVVRLIPDAPSASVFAFTNAPGSANYLADSIRISQRARKDSPTVVSVAWTDTAVTPWQQQTWTEKAPGVDAGTVPWREEAIQMPGIQDAGYARREALRRLNGYIAADLSQQLTGLGESLQLRRGDVVTVTDSEGLTAKAFRLIDHRPAGLGLWAETLVEYDASVYSDATATSPSTPDTDLPSPLQPPTITGLVLSSEIYQLETGRYAARIVASWDDPEYQFLAHYLIAVSAEGKTLTPSTTTATTWRSGPVQEGTAHIVAVSAVSVLAAVGTGAQEVVQVVGKELLPGAPSGLAGIEVGGELRLAWTLGADLDLTATELRYSTTGGNWGAATLIERVPAPASRHLTKVVPAGTWRIWAKSLDSVRTEEFPFGQESTAAVYIDVIVTVDPGSFLAGDHDFTTPSLFKMVPVLGGWATDTGGTWNALFTANVNTYTDILNKYQSPSTQSMFVTETVDFGTAFTGNWNSSIPTVDYSGSGISFYLDLSSSGGAATKAITGATNATPIQITATAHGYLTGDEVVIAAVGGNTAANGVRLITYVDANNFTITDLNGVNVAGNGTYTTGGTASKWAWARYSGGAALTTGRFARLRAYSSGAFKVTAAGTTSCAVITRSESFTNITSLASGGKLVELANPYSAYKTARFDPVGATFASTTADRILVHQESGIQLNFTLSAAGNVEQTISRGLGFVVGASQFLRAQIYLPGDTQDTAATLNVKVVYTDATSTTSTGTIPLGMWSTRAVAVSNGKTIDYVIFLVVGSKACDIVALVRNVAITNNLNTVTYQEYWMVGDGEPTTNSTYSSSNATNIRCGPSNSFMVYAFDAAGAQIAQLGNAKFEGV